MKLNLKTTFTAISAAAIASCASLGLLAKPSVAQKMPFLSPPDLEIATAEYAQLSDADFPEEIVRDDLTFDYFLWHRQWETYENLNSVTVEPLSYPDFLWIYAQRSSPEIDRQTWEAQTSFAETYEGYRQEVGQL